MTVRELDARVPLFVSAPGFEPGTRDALVEYIDLFPTLSQLCGLPHPTGIDGRSFVPVMEGTATFFRPAALTQTCRPWGKKRPIEHMGYSIRARHHRYTQWILYESGDIISEEIYHLREDPFQRENLINDPELKDLVSEHRRLLEETKTR